MSEFPREDGGWPGPDAVEKLESYPLSYGDGLCISATDLERKGEDGGVWFPRAGVWIGAKRARFEAESRR
jgi:hypothetical protein